MGIPDSISRLAVYCTRHGLRATIRGGALRIRRGLFSSRMVLFYCDLAKQNASPSDLPSSLRVEPKKSLAEVTSQDLEQMTSFWHPKRAQQNIEERFAKGASLWLIKSEGSLAGYGWTLRGRTVEPYYFPLGKDDVHLFDFYVFPRYRGQGMNPSLVTDILRSLAAERGGRAFIEAAEWNQAQLSSLEHTPFRVLGWVRRFTIFGRPIMCWNERGGRSNARWSQSTRKDDSTRTSTRLNSSGL